MPLVLSGVGGGKDLDDELVDAFGDGVADGANDVRGLACRVVEFPVAVGDSREVGADVAAAHGDHDVAGVHGRGGEELGRCAGNVDAEFSHRCYRGRADHSGGFGSGGTNFDAIAGEVGQ